MSNAFSQGLLAGASVRQNKLERRRLAKEAQQERLTAQMEAIKGSLDTARTELIATSDTFIEGVRKAREQDPTADVLNDPAFLQAFQGLAGAAAFVTELEADAVDLGKSLTGVEQASINFFGKPGTTAAQILAKTRIMQNQVAGTQPAQDPNIINFKSTKTGDVVAVDMSEPGGTERGRALMNNRDDPHVRVGFNFDDPAATQGFTTKMRNDLLSEEVVTLNLLSETAAAKEKLKDADLRTGFAGELFSGLNAVADQMSQISESLGIAEPNLLDSEQYDFSNFGAEAQASAPFRSNITAIAFLRAQALNTGDRLSNQDVQLQMNDLARLRGRGTLVAVLNELERSAAQSFVNRHSVMRRMDPTVSEPDSRITSVLQPRDTSQSEAPTAPDNDVSALVKKAQAGEKISLEGLSDEQALQLWNELQRLGIDPSTL